MRRVPLSSTRAYMGFQRSRYPAATGTGAPDTQGNIQAVLRNPPHVIRKTQPSIPGHAARVCSKATDVGPYNPLSSPKSPAVMWVHGPSLRARGLACSSESGP